MMARVLLAFCAVGAADGLSLRSQHIMASNRTVREHHSSFPSQAFVESKVFAALESGATAPFDDLLDLLTTMKKRYVCENAQSDKIAVWTAKQCDTDEASLRATSEEEGRKLTTKTNECEAADTAVVQKKKQIAGLALSFGYKGCFVDNTNHKRDLPRMQSDVNGPSSTAAQECAALCYKADTKYFGLQYNSQCFCGDTYGSQGEVDISKCDSDSSVGERGDAADFCGDGGTAQCGGFNAVYEILFTGTDDARKKIPKYEKFILDGTTADTNAVKSFELQRGQTQAAIKLVKSMAEKSIPLTLLQMSTQVQSLPDGPAKDMGSIALLQMEMKKGDNEDTNAYKALLQELITELEKYQKLLRDTETDRAAAWVKAKAGFNKDLKDAKDAVALAESNLIKFRKQLVGMLSAQKQCAKELLIQKKTTEQTAEDVETKTAACIAMKKGAKLAGEARELQLTTVDELLSMLEKSDVAGHVKEAVKKLKASDVKSFQCFAGRLYAAGAANTQCDADLAVATKEECLNTAVHMIGVIPNKNPWVQANNEYPTGCSIRNGGDLVPHWNKATTGAAKWDIRPVCRLACTGQVTLCMDGACRTDGKWWKVYFKKGVYKNADFIGLNRAANDQLNAIKVPAGCKATIYEDGELSGWSVTFPPGDYDNSAFQAAGAVNNEASSMVVENA